MSRISIFSPGTAHRPGLEASPELSDDSSGDDTNEAGTSKSSTDSEASSSGGESGSEDDEASSDDDSSSEEVMDESDDDDVRHADVLKRKDPKAAAWLRRTAEERAVCDGMEREEDGNLAQHIMNAHGFFARQYGQPAHDPPNAQCTLGMPR